jgi:hypothetical protein
MMLIWCVTALINVDSIRNDLLINWDRALSISLYYNHHDEDRKRLMTKKINKFYFDNKKLMEETQQNLTNVCTHVKMLFFHFHCFRYCFFLLVLFYVFFLEIIYLYAKYFSK